MNILSKYEETNVLTNQVGGDIRAGIIINEDSVLEAFVSIDGLMTTLITPIETYINDECDSWTIKELIEIKAESLEFIDKGVTIECIYRDDRVNLSRLSNEDIVITTQYGIQIV